MIAVDTSAIVSIVCNEPERDAFEDAIEAASQALISAVSVVEAKMVVRGMLGERGVLLADQSLALRVFKMTPPDERDVAVAYSAFVTFGEGSGHPAHLSFGDVFSYALASVRGLPLLFKGNDFAQTDIVPVVTLQS